MRQLAVLVVLMALCGDQSRLEAQNRVPNADFNEDKVGWNDVLGSSFWVTSDVDGCTIGSGALQAFSATITPSLQMLLFRGGCFAVTPGEPICFAVRYGEGGSNGVVLEVSFYTDTECGSLDSSTGAIGPAVQGSFTGQLSGCSTVPLTAVAARIGALSSASGSDEFFLLTDRFYAGSGDVLLLDDFEAESTCRWSAESS
jgi:hypothetical protein